MAITMIITTIKHSCSFEKLLNTLRNVNEVSGFRSVDAEPKEYPPDAVSGEACEETEHDVESYTSTVTDGGEDERTARPPEDVGGNEIEDGAPASCPKSPSGGPPFLICHSDRIRRGRRLNHLHLRILRTLSFV
ncbi:hypothetical protein KC340_g127 [Hortaea werneckii]|nr:hypothetical protein KC340_g127 [Hortaea werneckii]